MNSKVKAQKSLRKILTVLGFNVEIKAHNDVHREYFIVETYHKDYPDIKFVKEFTNQIFESMDNTENCSDYVEHFVNRTVRDFTGALSDKVIKNGS